MLNVTDRPVFDLDEPLSGPLVHVSPAPSTTPRGFVRSTYRHEWLIARPRAEVWSWLDDPATFTDSQVKPYRSEFVANDEGDNDGADGFAEGCYHGQVGPMLSLAGVLGAIEPDRYRDVQYFYGSYIGSRWLFRPTRVQFWLDDGPGAHCTVMRVRMDAHVRRRAQPVWERMMTSFWTRFGRSSARRQPCRWLF